MCIRDRAEAPKETPKEETKQESKPVESSETSGSTGGARFYSPLVLNIASKEGIGMAELEKIPGTGAEGRVTKKDILAYVANRGSKPAETKQAEAPKTETKPVEQKQAPKQEERKIELPKPKIDYNEEGLSVTEFDNIRQKMAEHMVASVRTCLLYTSRCV